MKLAPCPSCARHVRLDEAVCPFCRATFARPLVAVSNPLRGSRVAAIAIAAGLSAASCVPPPPTDDAGQNQALYGAPPPSDAGDDEDAGPAAFDAGGAVPAYGIPPPPVDSGPEVDAGGAVPAYGIPPPVDGG